jgi:hypothetical protein
MALLLHSPPPPKRLKKPRRLKRSTKCPLVENLPEIVPRPKMERKIRMTRAMYQRITVISKIQYNIDKETKIVGYVVIAMTFVIRWVRGWLFKAEHLILTTWNTV